MANLREERKKELLAEGALLREELAFQIQAAVRGPNTVTESIRLARKIRSIGVKPFAVGAGVLGLLLLKPWRFFIGEKIPAHVSLHTGESFTSKLIRYARALFPFARFVIGLRQPSGAGDSLPQILSVLLEKICGLLTEKKR